MSISRSSQLEVARALRSVPANPIFASNPQWPRAFSNRPPPLNGPLNRFTKSTLQIPEFPSKSKSNPHTNHVFSYFMVGTMGLLTGVGAKNTVNDFLVNMSASADVLAQAKVELAIASIPEGKNIVIKWRGKPVSIRHRTTDEIKEAQEIDWKTLRDPQPDEDRVQKPEWLVMLGVCTHLGCVPIGEAGEYGGWFCPCHGSHYDISGRARKGPAPLNLEVPQYSFPSEETIVIG
ncbi:hsp70 nucleotide exchange factor fes1 [Penicillium chrysogenum]|uniref:Cytochrome b-c1 complex subunit Rieske, mitochondrial n=1 Tax=Penicillium chrysogenum TaxID=5076 RepID=A0ABQ8WA63_PENCH|nr:hsp70 nucleotide exchange factor fes1 [Penicillium chrysogenum]